MDTNERRDIATARLTARLHFRQYLLVWAGVSVLVVGIWVATSATVGHALYFWPVWPILGMGIGAAAKAMSVYGGPWGVISEAAVDAEVARMSR